MLDTGPASAPPKGLDRVRALWPDLFGFIAERAGEPKPTAADPKGEWYCFERNATKTTDGEGWADVRKRRFAPAHRMSKRFHAYLGWALSRR